MEPLSLLFPAGAGLPELSNAARGAFASSGSVLGSFNKELQGWVGKKACHRCPTSNSCRHELSYEHTSASILRSVHGEAEIFFFVATTNLSVQDSKVFLWIHGCTGKISSSLLKCCIACSGRVCPLTSALIVDPLQNGLPYGFASMHSITRKDEEQQQGSTSALAEMPKVPTAMNLLPPKPK
jgi:hypothetical protein